MYIPSTQVLLQLLVVILSHVKPAEIDVCDSDGCDTDTWRTHGEAISHHRPTHNSEKSHAAQEKIILLWTTFFAQEDYYFGLGRQPFLNNCPVNNCITTRDKERAAEAAAVVFHGRNIDGNTAFPSKHEAWQLYVYFLLEHPYHQWNDLARFNGIFNLTMTYRLDSDIPVVYGKVIKKARIQGYSDTDKSTTSGNLTYQSINLRRPKLVAVFVTNCDTHSKRERYISELAKYIPVDIYGKCGALKCPEYHVPDPREHESCYEMLERDYKFYLSFENIFCRDYVTEKLYNILRFNVVPIVMGAVNYTEIAPPNSVINILDFKSPRHLADYLYKLDENDEEYMRYFEWQAHYTVVTDEVYVDAFCKLCEIVNTVDYPTKVYDRLDKWWDKQGSCDLGVMNRLMVDW